MGDVKRWSVTYTKHIKQKRKVYQDGLLELHTSSHKIMLYDDCEKLLDSRFVKKDDVIRSGETLAFDAYLVDIGDPEGDHKPAPNLNFQGRDKKITEKAGPLHGQKFRNNSISVEDRKINSRKNKAPSSNLSPSQKIIREFKKSELNKYGAPRNCPDTTKAGKTEWQVLYTTQITQKAKKYHDGVLRVVTCGSQGRQVMLYDASRRLLDSRFLKKDEVIGSGESLAFDGHLVDIGELEGEQKPLMDLNVQGRSCTAVGKTRLLHGQQAQHGFSVENGISELNNSGSPPNRLKTIKTAVTEWHALYTTQITQKAKKYHSGILRLALCGSYRMQATLLNEDGTILSHKYLNLSEDVRTGSAFGLQNYLVEVGEPRTSPEGEPQNDACSGKDEYSNCSSSDVDNIKLSRRVTVKKSLRDAHEIISILRKPMTQNGMVPIKRESVEQCHASQCSDFIHFDLQKVQRQPVQDSNYKRSEVDDHDEETATRHHYIGEISKSKAVHDDLSFEISELADLENKGESQPKNFTSSGFSLGSGASNISTNKFDAECTERSMTRPVSSIEESQVSVKLDFPDDSQPPTASVPHDESNGNVEIGDSLELMSSKATSSCCGSQFSKEVKTGNSSQPNAGSMGIDTRWCGGAFACGIASSSGCTSHDPGDDERNSSEEHKNANKIDECPSFDLGF